MKIKTFETIRRGQTWQRTTKITESKDLDVDSMADLYASMMRLGLEYKNVKIEINRDDRYNNVVVTIHGNHHEDEGFNKSYKRTLVVNL